MATETAVEQKEVAADTIVILFELENAAVAGRKRLFDLLKKNLAGAGVQLTPALFSHYGLKPTPEQCVSSLIEAAGSGKGDASKIGSEVNAMYVADLKSEKVAVNPALVKLLQSAAKKGFALGAISALEEADAKEVLERLGINVDVKLYAHKPSEPNFPRADGWLKLLKATTRGSHPGIAIASSMASCKSALAAGLRCVAIPDDFTGHQDFGGADVVIDSWDDVDNGELLGTLGTK